MDYKRKENETVTELVNRICSIKDSIGTWDDVRDILNKLTGTSHGESYWRKGFISGMVFPDSDYYYEEKETVNEDVKHQLEEIRKERKKLQTLNIERNRIDRCEARQELYYEYIGSVVESLPLSEFEELPCITNKFMDYVIAISDVHYGASFTSLNNSYSPIIAEERFQTLANEIIDFVTTKNINRIHIAMLGDCIQGMLRKSDLKLNDSSVVKATVEISRIIAQFLNQISKYVKIEYYHVPTSNHSQMRPLGSKASELADEDLEYVISNYISDLVKNNERINVHLTDTQQGLFIDVDGMKIYAMHGHQIKNVETAIDNLSNVLGAKLDYLILGHFHNDKIVSVGEREGRNIECLVAPSFIGSDPYSDSIMKGSKASVNIYGFEYYFGHIETYKIILN